MSRWFNRPKTLTHPSTNVAQCRLTTLIKANALTTALRRRCAVTTGAGTIFRLGEQKLAQKQ